ncbi:MAG: FAD-binding oxidoreductase, partial [Bacteroidota bacterium]
MTLSIWRYSHMLLALSTSLFLILASVTGVILAVEPISDATQPHALQELGEVSLAETVSFLDREYDELLEIEVTPSHFVIATAIDEGGSIRKVYIDPEGGMEL